jgi:hypothetical protein
MATPFKMKGHTLPGPNQKKSPMTEPVTLILAGVSAATAAAKTAAARKAAEKKKIAGEKAEATASAQEGISKDIGSKTKITD